MSWRARTSSLYAELAALAQPRPWWWLIAGGVAATETLPHDETYLACDAEPDADTLIAYRSPPPRDLVADAIARARAARTAIRELDGTLPAQPLAVTIQRTSSSPMIDRLRGARIVASSLDVAAFAFGDQVVVAHLDDPHLAATLTSDYRTRYPVIQSDRISGLTTNSVGPNYPARASGNSVGPNYPEPFVCVSMGDEPLETARHGHRRAWTDRGGPWLGLGRAGELAIVSTCHLVVDGYGHARLAARIAELVDARLADGRALSAERDDALRSGGVGELATHVGRVRVPGLSTVPGGVPLVIARREIVGPLPRVIPLAYRLGCILQRELARDGARYSPTIQIPVALGAKSDPLRLHRRVVAASLNVRFDARGKPEPFADFEARVRDIFARESASRGLVSRLLASARAIPAPLGWKRRGIAAKRPAWLEGFADVIGGRALLSRISVDAVIPFSYAVSSPSRLASADDPIGGCVITLVDDGVRGAITLCGSGQLAAKAILDELLDAPAASLRAVRST